MAEELPLKRIGVISGPNLAREVAAGEPAATVVASAFPEVVDAGRALLHADRFQIHASRDVIGCEWAGTLKNILAIASGTLDALELGWNARAMLITHGLEEMVRFGVAMGAEQGTFLGLAGMGDLLAACSSPTAETTAWGCGWARARRSKPSCGRNLGSTTEGVRTTRAVREFARLHGIHMPITEGVFELLEGRKPVAEVLRAFL